MKIQIKDEIQDVVYVEYFKNIPHSVITALEYKDRLIPHYWDFFQDGGTEGDLVHYNSGFGGDVSVIECPDYVSPKNFKIWHDKRVNFINPKNINVKILKNPLILSDSFSKSKNPFRVSYEVFDKIYCKECEACHSDYCNEHMYEDENDNYEFKYISDNTYVHG